ncbi:GATA transcription factor 9, partial [Tetrabaena socialis]
VKWFERRVNLEPSTKGIEESEREVFELDDTDVNPIGCISGKCRIIKAHNYEEAFSCCGNAAGWFFCRGYFQQSSNSFVPYTPAEMGEDGEPSHRVASQRGGGGAGWANGDSDEEDEEDDSDVPPPNPRRGQGQHHNPPPQQQPPNKRQKATGRTCVECGATTTPQWREGPMGPKTLCNACGVRYVRSQQKAAGQKRSSGGQKNGQGRPQ